MSQVINSGNKLHYVQFTAVISVKFDANLPQHHCSSADGKVAVGWSSKVKANCHLASARYCSDSPAAVHPTAVLCLSPLTPYLLLYQRPQHSMPHRWLSVDVVGSDFRPNGSAGAAAVHCRPTLVPVCDRLLVAQHQPLSAHDETGWSLAQNPLPKQDSSLTSSEPTGH